MRSCCEPERRTVKDEKNLFFSFLILFQLGWLYAVCQRGAERAAVQLVAGGEERLGDGRGPEC